MAITINSTSSANKKNDFQWIHITVNADSEDCKFTHTAPKDLSGDDLQAYVDGREDFYKRELLRNMYGGADCYNSSLEDFEAWVSAGCKNAEVKGTDVDGEEIVIKAEEVIEKKAWVDAEPPVDQASLIADLQAKVEALENA
tara:strand:+ start:340 stop:765 length:426 start_codon:yes stop_codon:yes gene_type:complete